MVRNFFALGIVLCSGCDLFEDVKETYEGLTDPLVVQSVVLGVEAAGVDDQTLESLNFDVGVGSTVFLADAKSASDIDNAPITGATINMNSVAVPETGNGSYTLEPGPLTYAPGASWNLDALIASDTSGAVFTLPPAPNVTVPTTHTTSTPMSLSLSGQGYDIIVGLVADITTGEITWSNEPEDIRDVYELATGSGTETLDIPETAFPTSGAYVVGIAGLTKATAADMDNMNTALSNITAGKMKLFPTLVQ